MVKPSSILLRGHENVDLAFSLGHYVHHLCSSSAKSIRLDAILHRLWHRSVAELLLFTRFRSLYYLQHCATRCPRQLACLFVQAWLGLKILISVDVLYCAYFSKFAELPVNPSILFAGNFLIIFGNCVLADTEWVILILSVRSRTHIAQVELVLLIAFVVY